MTQADLPWPSDPHRCGCRNVQSARYDPASDFGEDRPCAPTPFLLLWRSFWRRSAPRPPTSWCGGRRVLRRGGRGGQGDHRRLRAGDRQAGRAHLHPEAELPDKIVGGARGGASRPTSLFGLGPDYVAQWAFDDRLVDLSDADRPFLKHVRSGRARPGDAPQREGPGRRASTGCPIGRRPTTSTYGRACWSRRVSRSPTSRRNGRRSGRSGAIRCSRRCAKPLGRDDIWGIGLPMSAQAVDT